MVAKRAKVSECIPQTENKIKEFLSGEYLAGAR
jgi:hypothetical protein